MLNVKCHYLEDTNQQKYLDFLGGYGALPFGFNPPEIWTAIRNCEKLQEPIFIIPSLIGGAGELAKALVKEAPDNLQYVSFANSGSEIVETGLKLVWAKTGRRKILSTLNSYHGKTLAALSATGQPKYHFGFRAPVKGFDYIPFGDIGSLEATLEANKKDQYAAFIIEPIQGEGGINVPPVGYLSQVSQTCKKYNVYLILDEIQTGFGRTGSLFACQNPQDPIQPDILLLAKALGGGVVPIAAALYSAELYSDLFALNYSNTFAANNLASRVGLKTLEMLLRDDSKVIKHAATVGQTLLDNLHKLQKQYPQFLKAVRGRGLMIGLEFWYQNSTQELFSEKDSLPNQAPESKKDPLPNQAPESNFQKSFETTNNNNNNSNTSNITIYTISESQNTAFLLSVFSHQHLMAGIVSAYLLNVGKIRTAVTLNFANTLRIEPALTIEQTQCNLLVDSLRQLFEYLSKFGSAALLAHFVGLTLNQPPISPEAQGQAKDQQSKGTLTKRILLLNPPKPKDYQHFDSSLKVFTEDQQMDDLSKRFGELLYPFFWKKMVLNNNTEWTIMVLPQTNKQIECLQQHDLDEQLESCWERCAHISTLITLVGCVSRKSQAIIQTKTREDNQPRFVLQDSLDISNLKLPLEEWNKDLCSVELNFEK